MAISQTPTLDKNTYPLMMHLSFVPKYEVSDEEPNYDPMSQKSNLEGMAGSWSTKSTSTYNQFKPNDSDQQEDD